MLLGLQRGLTLQANHVDHMEERPDEQRAIIQSAKSNWKERLQKGQTFESWEEMKNFVVDYGVQTEKIIKTYKKDPARWLAVCKMNSPDPNIEKQCPIRIRAIEKKKTKVITIQISILTHTCEAHDHWQRRMHTNSDRLAKQIVEIVMRNRQTRACSLRDTIQALIHPDIKYHTVFQAKKRALQELDGREKDSFALIPSHCEHILWRDPRAVAKWAAPDASFESLFIMPSAIRAAFKHCRPLVAFDGTHTRSAHPQILLIATALDANNTVLMLAYCMVPTQNPTEWNRFLRLIRDAIPDLSKPGMVFISDREKGLLDGMEEFFPRGFHAFCSWHIGDNCRTKFNKKAQKAFEPLVYATTPEQYKRKLKRIKDHNSKWADYIEKTTHPKHYSRAYCPVRRWGHETSQQAESLNRALKPQRQEVALKQSNLLWDYEMQKFFEKRQLADSVTTPFPLNIMTILRHIEEKAMLLIAQASSYTKCRVTDHLGQQFLVELDPEWKCSCGDFQDKLYPCIHAWRACTKLHKRQLDYVSPFYSTESYKATYAIPIPAILHQDLEPNINCGEPVKRRQRGRPSEKLRMRFSKEDPVCRPRRCKECKVVGHDKRTCLALDAIKAQLKGKGPTVDSESDNDHISLTEQGESLGSIEANDSSGEDSEDSDGSLSTSESGSEPDQEFTLEAIHARKEEYCSDDDFSDHEDKSNNRENDGQTSQDVEGQSILDLSSSQSVVDLFSAQPSTQPDTQADGMSFSNLLATMSMAK